MDVDLIGRVNNIHLASNNCLLPLYEAIVNSIQSIIDSGKEDGRIDVRIIRDETNLSLDGLDCEQQLPITGFTITDNGTGFNTQNFKSFSLSDSTFKKNIGGKGIGRFLWLKAFSNVDIHSIYEENGQRNERRFKFKLPDGICNAEPIQHCDCDSQTTISLLNLKDKYKIKFPKSVSTISNHIAEHCLEFFILDVCPKIYVHDNDDVQISVNTLVRENIVVDSERLVFNIGNNEFNVTNLRLDSTQHNQHKVHYCAHKRAVKSENIGRRIPDLNGKLKTDDGRSFVYAAYVSGKYLDKAVSPDRTSFLIQDKDDQTSLDGVYWEELSRKAVSTAEIYLIPFTEPVKNNKRDRIKKFVETQAPQYRYILKSKINELRNIPAEAPDERLEVELCKIDHRVRIEIKEKAQSIIQTDNSTIGSIEQHSLLINKIMEEVNEVGQGGLARYIIHRKIVLDLFDKALQLNESGKYSDEDVVHSIIYPMRKTSDEIIDQEIQNLWIIDERLAYHKLLASDKLFKQLDIINSDSKERADIVIFNQPIAFADNNPPFSSVVIVEFKRPARNNFVDDDNPIIQVYDYVREIKSGTKTDINGRPLRIADTTQFYSYIIADMTNSLVKQAENASFKLTPDEMGYFHYNPILQCYTEIISFAKLISDAKKRNRILFDKLGLPI